MYFFKTYLLGGGVGVVEPGVDYLRHVTSNLKTDEFGAIKFVKFHCDVSLNDQRMQLRHNNLTTRLRYR